MSSVLVTGASRGIGFTLCQHFTANDSIGVVFAAARSKTPQLTKLLEAHPDRVQYVQLEVTDETSIENARTHVENILGDKGLDILVNNAGVMPLTLGGIGSIEDEQLMYGYRTDLESTFKVNVAGVHYVSSSFLPLLRKGSRKEIVNISSTVGSIAMVEQFKMAPVPGYKVSKAALNMLTVQYAMDLKDAGFTCIALSPGWVKTDLAGNNADLEPDESAKAVLDIIFNAKKEDTGKFFDVHIPGWEHAQGVNRYPGGFAPW